MNKADLLSLLKELDINNGYLDDLVRDRLFRDALVFLLEQTKEAKITQDAYNQVDALMIKGIRNRLDIIERQLNITGGNIPAPLPAPPFAEEVKLTGGTFYSIGDHQVDKVEYEKFSTVIDPLTHGLSEVNIRLNDLSKLVNRHIDEPTPAPLPQVKVKLIFNKDRQLYVKSGYRSQFHLPGDECDYSCQYDFIGKEVAQLGEIVMATVTFLSPEPIIHKLQIGTVFSVREGTRMVGYGEVIMMPPKSSEPKIDLQYAIHTLQCEMIDDMLLANSSPEYIKAVRKELQAAIDILIRENEKNK